MKLGMSVSVCKVWDNCVLEGWSLEYQEPGLVFHSKLHFLVISHTILFEVHASKFRSKMKLLLKYIFLHWKNRYFWKAEKGILGEGSI